MDTAIHRRVDQARAGQDDSVLARLASGWAVFGRQQFVAGYLLLLPDPVVPHLNALDGARRAQFLADMAHLGDALMRTLQPVRINYAIFGNVEPRHCMRTSSRVSRTSPRRCARSIPGPTTGTRRRPSTPP